MDSKKRTKTSNLDYGARTESLGALDIAAHPLQQGPVSSDLRPAWAATKFWRLGT
jgi:hypothetical protein